MSSKLHLVPELVQIDVRDWQTMVAFYQGVIGLDPIVLEPEHRYGWLQAGQITLALRGVEDLLEGPGSRVSLLFRVENIESAIEELERAGCHFYDKQLQTGESYQVAYFRDPEGNALAVFTDTDVEDK